MSVLGSSNVAVVLNTIVLGPYDVDSSSAYGLSSNQLTIQAEDLGGGLIVEQSNNNTTWYPLQTLSAIGVTIVNVSTRYVRVRSLGAGTPSLSIRLGNSSTPAPVTNPPVTPITIADGADSSLGSKSDSIATSTTASWSVISLLKGILGKSNNAAVTIADGSNVSQGALADTAATNSTGSWSVVSLLKAIFDAISGSISPAFTTVQASSLVVKSSGGSLYEAAVTSQGTAGYLMVFDATTLPANGTVTPKITIPLGTNTAITKSYNKPMQFTNGIVAAFSSTGPFTLTASATAFLSGMAK